MQKVWITPGCITCGACEFIAPDVFQVTDVSRIKADANMQTQCQRIKEAAAACPVNVIAYEE